MAEGALYAIKCQDPKCGYEFGAVVIGPDSPPLPPESIDEEGLALECGQCEHSARYEWIGWGDETGTSQTEPM